MKTEKDIKTEVKTNMHIFQVAVETYKVDHNEVCPRNSDVKWAKDYLPASFVNPYTNGSGEGKAYMSGEASISGIVGFRSDKDGKGYRITGFGIIHKIDMVLGY